MKDPTNRIGVSRMLRRTESVVETCIEDLYELESQEEILGIVTGNWPYYLDRISSKVYLDRQTKTEINAKLEDIDYIIETLESTVSPIPAR